MTPIRNATSDMLDRKADALLPVLDEIGHRATLKEWEAACKKAKPVPLKRGEFGRLVRRLERRPLCLVRVSVRGLGSLYAPWSRQEEWPVAESAPAPESSTCAAAGCKKKVRAKQGAKYCSARCRYRMNNVGRRAAANE